MSIDQILGLKGADVEALGDEHLLEAYVKCVRLYSVAGLNRHRPMIWHGNTLTRIKALCSGLPIRDIRFTTQTQRGKYERDKNRS
jgi:hypothetical protein